MFMTSIKYQIFRVSSIMLFYSFSFYFHTCNISSHFRCVWDNYFSDHVHNFDQTLSAKGSSMGEPARKYIMPGFWWILTCRYIGDTRIERKQSRFYSQSYTAPNPIITVTEHTPTPSPDYMKRQVGSEQITYNPEFLCYTVISMTKSFHR